jgi:Protein of unknown function (DUF2510)
VRSIAAGLDKTLRDFYTRAIGSLPDWRGRRASRRLCEQHLISTDGRRLSMEEHEIHRELKLPKETLSRLEAARLLRRESRSDNTYYELSHDALIEPILASSRYKGRVMAMFGIGYAALLIVINSVYVFVAGGAVLTNLQNAKDKGDVALLWFIACIVALLLLPLVVLPVTLLRGSVRSWRRYRRSREPATAGRQMRLRTPQGWYPDPQVTGQFRYWDGAEWTSHTSAAAAPTQGVGSQEVHHAARR